MNNLEINYDPEPALARFHASRAKLRSVIGPIGSGKTTACLMELLHKILSQTPDIMGRRRSRWLVIRNTYSELENTVLKTWMEWVPSVLYTLKRTHPMVANMNGVHLGDGTAVYAEIHWIALDRDDDVKKLHSLDITGAFINEARYVPKLVLDTLLGRVPRFPPKKDFYHKDDPMRADPNAPTPYWSGVWMDSNPPHVRHWLYMLHEIEKPADFEGFRQPPALIRSPKGVYFPNPKAENAKHQPAGCRYWMDLVHGKSAEWINVNLLGEYGQEFDGMPVYKGEFVEHFHVAKAAIPARRDLPLLLGVDFGLNPAIVAGQLITTPQGEKLHVLREWTTPDDEHWGIKQLCEHIVKPELRSLFAGMECRGWGDPSGKAGASHDVNEDCFLELRRQGLGGVVPAPSNDFSIRRDAVAEYLLGWCGLNEQGEPMPRFQLDPLCIVLREGFLGGYLYRRKAQRTAGRYGDVVAYKDQAEKNSYSHAHDALQYLCLGIRSGVRSDRPGYNPAKWPDRRPTWGGLLGA